MGVPLLMGPPLERSRERGKKPRTREGAPGTDGNAARHGTGPREPGTIHATGPDWAGRFSRVGGPACGTDRLNSGKTARQGVGQWLGHDHRNPSISIDVSGGRQAGGAPAPCGTPDAGS